MTLFRNQPFVSHSGLSLRFKIECDALTVESLDTLAALVASSDVFVPFSRVVGIPRGGLRFAKALQKYCSPQGGVLIADDVYTSGTSMDEFRAQHPYAQGVVVFARRPPPEWIKAAFYKKRISKDCGSKLVGNILV